MRYAGWSASKYCSVQCRIRAQSLVSDSGCWEWRGKRTKDGYGKLNFNQRAVYAHRAAYEAWHEPLRPNQLALHACDNPGCVNPDHLFSGSHADNAADKVSKSRQRFGEAVAAAKLTDAEIRMIRASGDATRALGRQFGVAPKTIRQIRTGQTWRHVT